MSLGSKLSRLRKENNYTQEQLAELLGVSRQAISKWESDAAYPETDKLIQISDLFRCPLDYLLRDAAEVGAGSVPDDAPPDPLFFRPLPRERKSDKTLWGVPLWHVARNARGIVAVGVKARGVIAVGMKARGVISFGMLSAGVLSFGMLSLGLLSAGLFALGGLSAGCFSAGVLSAGAISLGMVSFGAVAMGGFTAGALATGRYIAIGDSARAMIALGATRASGSLFQKIGELSAQDVETVKELLDSCVPAWLSWAKELFKHLL